jgi:ubiquinone/menaquinone biosynthesis C-methylase UbiE
VKRRLLDLICCPTCKSPFTLISEALEADDIQEGSLKCSKCQKEYPVIKGIPRILPLEEIENNYSENFKMYWLNTNWPTHEASKKRFFDFTQWQSENIKGKLVLEAGCGGGRWLYQFAKAEAGEIVAFDYTQSVEKAQEICKDFPNIHYVQADLFHMPFPDRIFDIAHCHGVLHTTPDVKESTRQLSFKVKPGGEMAILLYRNVTWIQFLIDSIICEPAKRLPLKLNYYLSFIPTVIEYIPGAVPLLENIIHLSGQPSFVLKHIHNFDWFSCHYRHRVSAKQGVQWMQDFGFADVLVLNTNEFRVRSRYPRIRKFKEWLLDKGFFLKATLGLRGKKR